MKSEHNSEAEWTDEELYKMVGEIYEYVSLTMEVILVTYTLPERFIFLEQDPAKELNTEDAAKKHMEELAKIVRANLRAISGGRVSARVFQTPTEV